MSWWKGFQDSRHAERVSPAQRCGEQNHTETVTSRAQASRSTVSLKENSEFRTSLDQSTC